MTARQRSIMDGNQAAAHVAHRLSEVMAIYPITPSSPMGELADVWTSAGVRNIWGALPSVTEMQSEGGAAGAIHGALQSGSLSTTFTASQGLLLMIPNMYKIAGELTPTVFHVTARTLATHALSIFGDHSDVMAARATGFAMLCAANPQEVMDLALVSHAASLECRVPFLHFFDGFRTSHELRRIEVLSEDDLRAMVDDRLVIAHRGRSLNPERPVLRGSAQNPDVFFQAREAANPYYDACPAIVQQVMDRLAARVGRAYRLFDYVGAPDAERVIVVMGSAADTVEEAVEHLVKKGEKVGVVKVRLFRPFASTAFVDALPATVRTLAVLDRTKEPGSAGEPLYQDVATALLEHGGSLASRFARLPRVIGGRYGLSSKEFTPAMVAGVFAEMNRPAPKNHFTVGIVDDVGHTSLAFDADMVIEDEGVRAVFYGLGSDGTVSANKNSIKIIGQETDQFVQAYFVYDSKKAGSVTVSHLRFGKRPIRSAYLVQRPNFIACHQPAFVDRLEMLAQAEPGAIFLLNTPARPEDVWATLPAEVQRRIVDKGLRLFAIDAYRVAGEAGLGRRINTVMQTCFFALSGVLPREEAIERIKAGIRKSYGAKGAAVVDRNFAAVDQALSNLHEIDVSTAVVSDRHRSPAVSADAPDFVRRVLGPMMAGVGDELPVSAMPVDGTFPTGTTRWEKRNIALELPVWEPPLCIQCNKCVLVCPHAAIRANVYEPEALAAAPASFVHDDARGAEFAGQRFTLQVAPEDCTGCGLCVEICPAEDRKAPADAPRKALNMVPCGLHDPLKEREAENFRFFLSLPEFDRRKLKVGSVKGSQFLLPLFEYSGACAGCGETPYVKLVSQLFGDRAMIANATGCSSIYGGNLPTTPWTINREGRGPVWSNSLFEDNAEFGLGFRLAIDRQRDFAAQLLHAMTDRVGTDLVAAILNADQSDESGIAAQRERVDALKRKLHAIETPESFNLRSVVDALVQRSIWIIGGDGWAYDIGFGGVDHVLASGRNVNILVLDTEVYSNTGGQMSKATPLGAVARFAADGKRTEKKDLGAMAMNYSHVYVAQIAMGSNDNQTVKAIVEAESYDGPSLIIAYAHCIAHGIDMRKGLSCQAAAVSSGHWPLFRYDPRRTETGKNPFQLDSKAPTMPLRDYMLGQNRFRQLLEKSPEQAEKVLASAQHAVERRYKSLVRRSEESFATVN